MKSEQGQKKNINKRQMSNIKVKISVFIKVGLARSKKICFICFNENPFKNDDNCLLFHLKSYFCCQNI